MEIQELLDILYPGSSEDKKDRILQILEGHIDWKNRHRIHDWKNYVPDGIKNIWVDLTLNEKLLIYHQSEIQADNEEWD
jgi:methionine salvage enolase-phosphatase E1